MHVHFVCTGNSYRSRLAEATFNSRAPSGLSATSSGIKAHLNENGAISWYAARVLADRQLLLYTAASWTQTDAEALRSADYVVFLTEEHHAYCCEHFAFDGRPHSVWNVPDVDVLSVPAAASAEERAAILLRAAEGTFEQIAGLVDRLLIELGAAP
jgi:protein-tyrosine-phosphatase